MLPDAPSSDQERTAVASRPWWTTETVLRVLVDLLRAELSRLRPGWLGLPPELLPPELLPPERLPAERLPSSAPGPMSNDAPSSASEGTPSSASDPSPSPASGRTPEAQRARIQGDFNALELDTLGLDTLGLDTLGLDTLGLESLEFLDIATLTAVQFHLCETGLDDRLLQERHLGAWARIILDSRARWDQALSFQTSGSTGQPKLCTHTLRALEYEIQGFAHQLADRQRILSAVPAHHIYGFLFTAMLPAVLEAPVLDLRAYLPRSALRRAQPGDLIVGHPAFFELATRGDVALAADVTILTSTAPCPPALWQRLDAVGSARIIEVYGSSEHAGIGMREAPDAPFRLLPQWSRVGETERLQRTDRLTTAEEVEPQDRLQWLDAHHFQVLGRRDGAVQIAGVNVFPQRVEALLRTHPEVAEAAVRLAGIELGGRLKAFVVPAADCGDAGTLPQRLDAWLAPQLSAPERPRAIRIGSQLPQSPTGRLTDWLDEPLD